MPAWGFLLAVWEFVVGDDWWTALGVVLALALTGLLAEAAISAWWVMPPAVLVLLALSIRRAARRRTTRAR
jgi:membrane protein implicated in regulation of membrane protease activity